MLRTSFFFRWMRLPLEFPFEPRVFKYCVIEEHERVHGPGGERKDGRRNERRRKQGLLERCIGNFRRVAENAFFTYPRRTWMRMVGKGEGEGKGGQGAVVEDR